MKKNILIAVAVTFVGTSLLWLGGLVSFYIIFYGGAPPFRVDVQYPMEVTLGDEFDLKISAENAQSKPVNLASIDLFDSFFDGFELISSEPPYEGRQHLFNFHTLWFQRELMPDSAVLVHITLRATKLGTHGGQIEVCTSLEACTSVYANIEVVEDGDAS